MNIYTQRGGRCEDKTVFDKHGFFSGNSSQAQNLIIIKSLRLCCSEMFVLNVCIPLSFPRVLKTFSSTSSGISYLESIEEKASWRLHGVRSVSIPSLESRKEGFHFRVQPRPQGAFPWLWRWGAPPPKPGKSALGTRLFRVVNRFLSRAGLPTQIIDVVLEFRSRLAPRRLHQFLLLLLSISVLD